MGFYGNKWINVAINESSGLYNIIFTKVKYNVFIEQFYRARSIVNASKLSKSEKEYLLSFINKKDPDYKDITKPTTSKINLNDLLPDIEKDIKQIEKKLLNTDYKNKIRKSINEGIKNNFIDDENYIKNSTKIPSLNCSLFEDYFIIIDDDQMIRQQLSWVLEDIIKELKKINKYNNIDFDIGDGDEGCIYCYLK